MRERAFRAAALVIGLLGIASLAWQLVQPQPAGGWQLDFVGLQVIVLGVFVVYGFGLAYRSPSGNPAEPSTREDAEPVAAPDRRGM